MQVLMSPTADTITVAEERVHVIDLHTARVVDLPSGNVDWTAYHPDGRTLVTVQSDGTTQLWRVADGELLATRSGRGSGNSGAIAFSADGTVVARADKDGTLVALDAQTLEPTGLEIPLGVEPWGIRTGADGVFAAITYSADQEAGTDIVFGDLDDRRVLSQVHIASWGPRTNFSPDGKRYAVGGFDGRLGVIDVATGNYRGLRDPVHDGGISWVTFSPDGRTLASMGFDGDLTLSDPVTATPRARVQPGSANTVGSIGYDPDGHTVLVGYQDGTVLAYETDPAAWVARACQVAGRSLTEDEWRDAFGDAPRRDTCPLREGR